MGATSLFSATSLFYVSYGKQQAQQLSIQIVMMAMVIMMIKNWLHFGYSDSDMQGEKSARVSNALR
jgi:hypothetical protein